MPASAQHGDLKTAQGRRLHYARGGQGPDLVLIHGALSVLEDPLIALYETLSPAFTVTAFDRPGHGRSERGRLEASMWIQAEVLREGARSLGLRRPVLVGHSFGGSVAMAWALSHPDEVAGVVALAPVATPELRAEHMLFGPRAIPLLGDIIALTVGPVMDAALGPLILRAMFHPQDVPERVRAEFPFQLVVEPRHTQADGEDAVAALPDLGLAALRYAACRVPVRVLAGDRDRIVNPALHGRVLASLVPDGDFQSFPGLGHMLHHFAPEAVAAAAGAVAGG